MLSALPPKNANLGRFTNFVNLLGMCGVSVWSGLLRLGALYFCQAFRVRATLKKTLKAPGCAGPMCCPLCCPWRPKGPVP